MEGKFQTGIGVPRIAAEVAQLSETVESSIASELTCIEDPGLPAGGNLREYLERGRGVGVVWAAPVPTGSNKSILIGKRFRWVAQENHIRIDVLVVPGGETLVLRHHGVSSMFR